LNVYKRNDHVLNKQLVFERLLWRFFGHYTEIGGSGFSNPGGIGIVGNTENSHQ